MANHLYGGSCEEHYEKEVKDFTPTDWVLVSTFWVFVLVAVITGFLGHIGYTIEFIGVAACMVDILTQMVFHKKSKITKVFVVLGIMAIIAGMIVAKQLWDIFQYYVVIMYMVIAFGVAFICFFLKMDSVRKKKENAIPKEETSFGNMVMVMGIFWMLAGIAGIIVLVLMMNGVISFT